MAAHLPRNEYMYLRLDDPKSLLEYAKKLEGHTFRDVLELGITPDGLVTDDASYDDVAFKGGMGNLIEERYFGYRANSDSRADFPEAGVELKTTCFDIKADGSVRAGERLVLGMISYDEGIEARFGEGSCVNEDINKVLDEYEAGEREIPDFDMLVGGFPCQDYSVAKPLSYAKGIEGKKGVLWWDIYRMLHLKKPKYLLLESPVKQRGRDFAIILSCLAQEGYSVEWRVVNAAEYGMPQKRRRVYIYGEKTDEAWDAESRLKSTGVMARAFPIEEGVAEVAEVDVSADPYDVSEGFGVGKKTSPFQNAGVMQNGQVLTAKTRPAYEGERKVLADIVVPDSEVPSQFFIDDEDIPKWEHQRAAKKEPHVTKDGFEYVYSEGAMAWPDPLDKPARTILTGEGGRGASRMKHAVMGDSGRIRRLVPDELDQVQMFPKGWTDTGMTDGHRAFCMGNALVVGIPHAIGKVIAEDARA